MKKLVSMMLTAIMVISLLPFDILTVSAETNINIGDYIQMGTYYGEPILWRCVDIDTNGPLLVSDRIIDFKPYDAKGSNSNGSHTRTYNNGEIRKTYGSDYWADSNIRCWLNSTATKGNVIWECGNPPTQSAVLNGFNEYSHQAGFLSSEHFNDNELKIMKYVSQKTVLNGYEYTYPTIANNTMKFDSTIDNVLQNYSSAYSEYTTDRIFLLDIQQLVNIYENEDILGKNYHLAKVTAEAIRCADYSFYKGLTSDSYWHYWLRTPSALYEGGSSVRWIAQNGEISSGYAWIDSIGIRPAFYVKDNCCFENGNGTKSNPYNNPDIVRNISISSVSMKYNSGTYDLILQPINIDKESDAEVSVKVNYEDGTGKEKIYISQNTEKAVELENNTYKTFKPTEVFDAGKDIYILIVNEETGDSFSERTRLKIVDNTANGEWFPSSDVEGLNFKLGKETGFTIPDSVAVFGGTEIKWDFDFIPISVEYDREDNNKINVVFGTSIASSDGEEDKYFKDFDFKEYKKDFKKAASKQGRTLKQLRNDFKMSNAYKMNLFGGKVIGGGSGKPSFDFDVAGYAEAKIIDGNFTFVEGQLCFEAEVSYTYQGQLFIWVVPVYYEIGGGIGAGFEGNMINIAPETFIPEFEAYLTAKVKANIGAGIGVAKVATVGASGEGSLNLKTALHKDYLKAWGEGEANFNVKVFGKEVAKKPFGKGDFLIYETGNANGLISDSAVKLAALEDENVYSGIDINKVYENESRSYASSSTEWYGDIPPISLMTAEYTNKNLQLLAENVYTESTPMMCNIDGQKVMVMLWDNTERDAVNRTMVVYSVYDNETNLWSSPVPVYDDGTADFYPCFNDGYLVWQNEKSLLNDSMTLLDIAKLGEICVSKWNGNGFDEPVTITDNSVIDTQPFVCASDSEVSVVWTTNSENDIIGTSGSNSILKSSMADTNWNDAVIVKDNLNSVVNLSAGYTDDDLNIAYVIDGDNDLQTINERDICIITENEEYKLTDNDVLDSNPVFEGNMIYYYSNGNIEYGVLGDNGKVSVFEEMKAGLTDNFIVDANETGDVAIWWAKNTDNATEIFCTLYKDGEWSDVIQISDTGNQSKYPAGILEADGSMYVAYNNNIWQDGSVIQSDLYTIDLLPSYDLSVTDAYIDEDSMVVYATIKNTGELNIDSYTLSLIDGTVNSQKVIGDGLKAGESADVEIEYIKPENLDKRTITLSVAIDDEEYNSDNNLAALTVGNCDVNITEVRNYEKLPTSLAVAVISNNGYSDTGKITVCLCKEMADGIVEETQIIDNLSAGESTEVTFNYNIVENSNIQWYVTAESENEEISLGNNDSYFINNYLSSVSEYSHEILRYSIKEKSLVVNAYAENNTAADLTAVSILAVYDINGRLKGLKQSDLAAEKYGNATLDFTIDDYSYSNGDYMKLFMWNGLNTLMPICSVAQANIIQ